jgi:hypothetical protein
MTTTMKRGKPRKIDVITPTIQDDEFSQDEDKQPVKDGLPWQAFALVGDKADPLAWRLPHHTRQVYRAIKGKIGYERTVDWENMPLMVAYLSRQGVEGQRVPADEFQILAAAKHLASHYLKAGKPLPDALAVLV